MKRIKVLKILLFFISFTVSVTPLINKPESSDDFIIFIISFISSFEIYKVNTFPALAALFPFKFFKFIYYT